jgi:hypothetical protein
LIWTTNASTHDRKIVVVFRRMVISIAEQLSFQLAPILAHLRHHVTQAREEIESFGNGSTEETLAGMSERNHLVLLGYEGRAWRSVDNCLDC